MDEALAHYFPREVLELSFFFGDFKCADDAAKYVTANYKGPGTFLLRPSTRSPGALTLSIGIDNTLACHVSVKQRSDVHSKTGVVFYIIPERTFSTFHELYAYYTTNDIHNLEQVSNVKLLNPLTRTHQSSVDFCGQLHPAVPASPDVPLVPPNEIPSLPQKKVIETGNAATAQNRDSTQFKGVSIFPELSSFNRRPERVSTGSASGDNVHLSGSSGGSAANQMKDVVGAVGGADVWGAEYIAPGSASVDKFDSNPTSSLLSNTTTTRQAGENYSNLNIPISSPLSKKDQKKLQKKEEKQKKKEKKKGKKKSEMDELVQLGWCRPPMPTPVSDLQLGEVYYSSPRLYKNHLEELKRMLQESDICDCGLRMMDAELVDGWTVHRSREKETLKHVFYQHENGNTTWEFPVSIAPSLSVQQVQFIVKLCKEAGRNVPPQVMQRYQSIMYETRGIGH